MGSHFVSVFSIDEKRIRTALGSGDRKILNAWLRAIRKQAGTISEETIEAREEAAEQMIAGGVTPGERPDGHHFGYAFLELCKAWADNQTTIECYVAKEFPALDALAAQAKPNPFGVPQSPYATGHVAWHEATAVPKLRKAFAAVKAGDSTLMRYGGSAQNLAQIDAVLADAESAGRGIVVSWSA